MKKTTTILLLVTGLTMLSAPAAAQTTKNMFLDVNVGVQAASRSFTVESFPIVYEETAIVSASHKVGSAPLLDISGGYRVWRDLSIGLAFSYASDSAAAVMTAAVPHPIFFDRRVTVTKTAEGLKHSEKALHLQFVWNMPVTDKIDASFIIGPSAIWVNQELIGSVSVPALTQDATPAIEKQSDAAAGFNLGADLSYLLTPRYGVGGFVRYVGGKVGLPAVPDLKLGGFQLGGGVRFRF